MLWLTSRSSHALQCMSEQSVGGTATNRWCVNVVTTLWCVQQFTFNALQVQLWVQSLTLWCVQQLTSNALQVQLFQS
eukprot:365005-Chlamydomonas_euryale.AAC.3